MLCACCGALCFSLLMECMLVVSGYWLSCTASLNPLVCLVLSEMMCLSWLVVYVDVFQWTHLIPMAVRCLPFEGLPRCWCLVVTPSHACVSTSVLARHGTLQYGVPRAISCVKSLRRLGRCPVCMTRIASCQGTRPVWLGGSVLMCALP